MPAERYSSAQALAGDIQRWLNGERPQETPRLLSRLGRALRRRARRIVQGLLVAVSALAVIVLALREPEPDAVDPDKIVREYERELAQGNPVTLIGETGDPKWLRWRVGENSSKTTRAPDGTFRVHAQDTSLLELLTDPQTDQYRFVVKVRHDKSNPGRVGIYFGHQSFPVDQEIIQSYIRTSFDGLRGMPQAVVQLGTNIPQPSTKVKVAFDIYAERQNRPIINESMAFDAGPSFATTAEDESLWHELEVTISSQGIQTKWDGQPFVSAKPRIKKPISDLTEMTKKKHLFATGILPDFVPRGGLGLYVYHGSASFCSASICPLVNRTMP
jgi:serine/threonine-protein kinase